MKLILKIGEIKIDPPVVLAPMAGVTDLPFRIIAKEMGCGLVCGEMISDKALTFSNARTMEMLRIDSKERPISMQLFGSDPETMGKAASLLAEAHPEIIDINMGCPVPKVVKNCEGSSLLKDLNRAARVTAAVLESVSTPVTVKMRSGWDENNIVGPELAKRVEALGVAAVAVHARTREQFYSGKADWSVIRRVKEEVGIPVIGNGDVYTAADARRMMEETRCDAVMVGRGAMGNPWLFREIAHFLKTGEHLPPPTMAERFGIMRRHLLMQLEYCDEKRGVLEMRKHLGWYLKGLPEAARMRERVNQIHESDELYALLDEYEHRLA
jgi:tRNA-dihydrouridine synthase B